jgi:hypothetical protein
MEIIELDIVQQYFPMWGLKSYIIIESETGEVVEHDDLLHPGYNNSIVTQK